MSNVETIQAAESRVDTAEAALSAVRVGLEAAEVVADAVEEVQRRSRALVMLLVIVTLGAIVAVLVAKRRSADEE